jgi:hypothetical protein
MLQALQTCSASHRYYTALLHDAGRPRFSRKGSEETARVPKIS